MSDNTQLPNYIINKDGMEIETDNSLVNYVIDSDAKIVYKSLDVIRQKYYENTKRIKVLEEENARLKSDHYKDEELARLNNEIDELKDTIRNSFVIEKCIRPIIDNWKIEHRKTCKHTYFKYIFYPTELGCMGKIQCECGEGYTYRDIG